jgi:hypothetical protein
VSKKMTRSHNVEVRIMDYEPISVLPSMLEKLYVFIAYPTCTFPVL